METSKKNIIAKKLREGKDIFFRNAHKVDNLKSYIPKEELEKEYKVDNSRVARMIREDVAKLREKGLTTQEYIVPVREKAVKQGRRDGTIKGALVGSAVAAAPLLLLRKKHGLAATGAKALGVAAGIEAAKAFRWAGEKKAVNKSHKIMHRTLNKPEEVERYFDRQNKGVAVENLKLFSRQEEDEIINYLNLSKDTPKPGIKGLAQKINDKIDNYYTRKGIRAYEKEKLRLGRGMSREEFSDFTDKLDKKSRRRGALDGTMVAIPTLLTAAGTNYLLRNKKSKVAGTAKIASLAAGLTATTAAARKGYWGRRGGASEGSSAAYLMDTDPEYRKQMELAKTKKFSIFSTYCDLKHLDTSNPKISEEDLEDWQLEGHKDQLEYDRKLAKRGRVIMVAEGAALGGLAGAGIGEVALGRSAALPGGAIGAVVGGVTGDIVARKLNKSNERKLRNYHLNCMYDYRKNN